MQNNTRLSQQIKKLDDLTLKELKQKFFELYGFNSGDMVSLTIKKRLIYKLQEIEMGGISNEDKMLLETIADKDPFANLIIGKNEHVAIKGMRLSREWKGEIHDVISNGNGSYLYKNRSYKSLSAIAREITGTRWNGKVFFGVKK